MRYVRQFFIILLISFLGELIRFFVPAPIPASVYGLALFFLALQFRVIKLEDVEETSEFLLVLMPLTLVPLTTGIVESLDALKKAIAPALLLGVLGTILTSVVAGGVAEWTIRRRERGDK